MSRAVVIALFALVVCRDAAAQQVIGGCPVLPANNIWNTPIDTLPVLANSTAMVNTIGAARGFHADFGAGLWEGGPIGIPFITVSNPPKFPATFLYDDESDPGPYGVPLNAPIEGGSNSNGDRHAIAIDTATCTLYELYRAFPQASSWVGDSGAIYDLRSNALRPSTWTSADAAGLPIVPGLVTWEEVQSGEIRHAIRFTVPQTRREFVWPARHYASNLVGTQYPRMGERFRLKASVNISTYPADVQVILRAMKKYGIILADNGSAWYLSGKPDERWNNNNLRSFSQLLGSNFEAVDATVLRIDPNSGAAIQNGVNVTVTPSTATLRIGHPQTFSATVTGAASGVQWDVNGTPGGDAIVGTIDSAGQYVPPSTLPNPAVVTVRATSTAVPTASGTASVTLIPPVTLTSVNRLSIANGVVSLTANGAGFVPGSVVWFNSVALNTTFVSATRLTATGNAPAPSPSAPVFVRVPDGDSSNVLTIAMVSTAEVSVTLSPTTASLKIRKTRTFTATVLGSSNTAVTWKVNGMSGGNASVGTISAAGLYSAPRTLSSASKTVSVSATSVADPTKVATATVTIMRR